MKCPFRLNKINVYTDLECSNGTKITVLDGVVEDYPECYEHECACYRWDVSMGGYYCAQVKVMDDNLDIGTEED